jgi:hypothetical protein
MSYPPRPGFFAHLIHYLSSHQTLFTPDSFTITSSDMTQNRAAWIMAAGVKPFVIDKAPICKPGGGGILIKAHAVAVVSFEAL